MMARSNNLSWFGFSFIDVNSGTIKINLIISVVSDGFLLFSCCSCCMKPVRSQFMWPLDWNCLTLRLVALISFLAHSVCRLSPGCYLPVWISSGMGNTDHGMSVVPLPASWRLKRWRSIVLYLYVKNEVKLSWIHKKLGNNH